MTDRSPYRVAYDRRAFKELSRIDRPTASRIADAVDRLGVKPFPPGSRKLVGYGDLWRIRVGDYRVLYTVDQGELLIIAVRIAHRRAVYRRLPTLDSQGH